MKGVKKCYIVYLILFGLLAPLFLTSSDTSAYEYKLQYLPFTTPNVSANNGIQLTSSFRLLGYEDSNFSQQLTIKDLGYYYIFSRDSFDTRCSYFNRRSIVQQGEFISIPYYLQPEEFHSNSTSPDPFQACYSNLAISNDLYNFDTIPADYTLQFQSYLPFRYNLNGAYLFDSSSDNGLNRQTKFDFAELFTEEGESDNVPDYVTRLQIPLGVSNMYFPAGTTLSFRGAFYLDDESASSSLTLDGSLKLISEGFSSFDDYYEHLVSSTLPYETSCTLIKLDNTLHPDQYRQIIRYQCDLTVSNDTNVSGFTLVFSPGSSGYIWSYPGAYAWIYESSILITNNIYEPDPNGNVFQTFTLNSSNISDVPGAVPGASWDIVSDDVNWTSTLTKLFNFSFINPFQPIFNMFNDQSSCASIPTLAGMLHSNETQICPFFSSNIRSVLTPVFSIVSVMLIFGFVVRWLGSSSGNMFEDQTSHKWDNTQFKRRGVK